MTGFQFRRVSPKTMSCWIGLQLSGMTFQWMLWQEAKGNLALYESTLAEQCAPAHLRHGICVGPAWNLSMWDTFSLEGTGRFESYDCRMARRRARKGWRSGGEFGQLRHRHTLLGRDMAPLRPCVLPNRTNHTVEFNTTSRPPTFVLVVDPVARARREGDEAPPDAAAEGEGQGVTEEMLEVEQFSLWSLRLDRLDPPPAAGSSEPFVERRAEGQGVISVEDLSEESAKALSDVGRVRWRATVVNRGWSSRQTRFDAFVEEATLGHVEELRRVQCSFTSAWKAFNREHQGRLQEVARLACALLGSLLCASAGATFVVFVARLRHLHLARLRPERGTGCCFHGVVLVKFLFVDVAQQACIVLYLLRWFEEDGMRCQLCLFHPGRCDEAHPFKPTTLASLACAVLSSLSNQLLVSPAKLRPGKASAAQETEDACWQACARFAAACVSTLPVTTAAFFASPALLEVPVLVQFASVLPCAVGWLTVGTLLLCWFVACCSDL